MRDARCQLARDSAGTAAGGPGTGRQLDGGPRQQSAGELPWILARETGSRGRGSEGARKRVPQRPSQADDTPISRRPAELAASLPGQTAKAGANEPF